MLSTSLSCSKFNISFSHESLHLQTSILYKQILYKQQSTTRSKITNITHTTRLHTFNVIKRSAQEYGYGRSELNTVDQKSHPSSSISMAEGTGFIDCISASCGSGPNLPEIDQYSTTIHPAINRQQLQQSTVLVSIGRASWRSTWMGLREHLDTKGCSRIAVADGLNGSMALCRIRTLRP